MSDVYISKKTGIVFWSGLILIYIVLFEFILPVNKFLPKPSVIIESLSALLKEHSFGMKLIYTLSAVYVSVFASYISFRFFAGYISRLTIFAIDSLRMNFIFKYFPLLGFITVFIFWFPGSSVSEFLFLFLVALFYLAERFRRELRRSRKEYLEPLLINASDKKKVINEISWKMAEPGMFKSLRRLHLLIWEVILVFEFIKGNYGLGTIYRSAFEFRDLSVLFLLSFGIMIIYFLGDLLLRYLQKKYIFWEIS